MWTGVPIATRSYSSITSEIRIRTQPCEAALKGNWGDLKNWTLYQSQLETAIRRVYDELDGKLSP